MPVSQLRIAMLSVHSCPLGNLGTKDTGGMSVCIRELARELSERGHLVDIYTRVHDPKEPQIVSLAQNARLIHLRDGSDEELPKLALYSYLADFACNLENFRKDNNLHYDLIFSHYWLSGWVGRYLELWWHAPHIIMFHTLGAVKNATGIGEDEPELRLATERELAQNCQRIIAPTEKEKKELIQRYDASAERISVIPCGVNLELFQPIEKEMARKQLGFVDDKLILYVGRIEPLKGIEQLVKTMPQLEKKARLLIIGGDEDSLAELERLIYHLNLENSVSLIGSLRQERLPSFYSAADVCVIPSYYESFGLVALEALACGTPVVATDVGELKSIIRQGETGYIVSDNTPDHLAEKIALLLAQPNSDREAIITRRVSVSRFSWSSIAEAVIKECYTIIA